MEREEAIKIIEANCSCSDSKLREACAMFIPELRESEDERIRKYLIEELKASKSVGELKFSIPAHTKEKCIAYLEKQKEQKPLIKKGVKYYCIKAQKRDTDFHTYAFTIGTEYTAPENNVLIDNNGHSWDLTRQTPEWIFERFTPKEQKHPNGCFTCDEYKEGYAAGRLHGFTAGYNKAKQEQKPAEWNEVDSATLDCAVEVVERAGLPSLAASLKSLRPQPKQEWSEEDKRILKGIIGKIDHDQTYGVSKDEMLNFLKKL